MVLILFFKKSEIKLISGLNRKKFSLNPIIKILKVEILVLHHIHLKMWKILQINF